MRDLFAPAFALLASSYAYADVETYSCQQVAKVKAKSNEDQDITDQFSSVLISGSRLVMNTGARQVKLLRIGEPSKDRETYMGDNDEIALKVSTPGSVSFILTAPSGDKDLRLWHFVKCKESHE